MSPAFSGLSRAALSKFAVLAFFRQTDGVSTPGPPALPAPSSAPPLSRRDERRLATVAEVDAGAADPDRTPVPPTLEVGDLLQQLLDPAIPDYPPRLAGIALTAWASVLGFLVTEIFGSLPRLVTDTDQMYRAHVCTVM